jgi:rhodanese-related sulfurtransferase
MLPMPNPTQISPTEAQAKMAEGVPYVDVRTVEEFEAGHPAGAVNVPLNLLGASGMVPNADFMKTMESSFPKDAPVILGCKSGGRSFRAAQMLVDTGFATVFDQRAGWDGIRDAFGRLVEPGWARQALPAEPGQPSGRSWADMRKTR